MHVAKGSLCDGEEPGDVGGLCSMGVGVEGQELGQQCSGFALRYSCGSTSGKLSLAFLFNMLTECFLTSYRLFIIIIIANIFQVYF